MASAWETIEQLTTRFEAWPLPELSNPLGWPGYAETLRRERRRTGLEDSVLVGQATIGDREVVLACFDFGFRGGTLGGRAGIAIASAIERAVRARLPFVSLTASGGVRVEEGMVGLTQLHRVAAALAAARRSGVPHLTVLGHPTTGGVWASLGSIADVALAVRGAEICFAGSRLRDGDEPPEAFAAAAQLEAGAVDAVIGPEHACGAVTSWVAMLSDAMGPAGDPCPPPPALGAAPRSAEPWDSVLAARSPARHQAGDYLGAVFTERLEICGDRAGGRDDGVCCGLGRRRDGVVVAFAAQLGTATRPAGYRTVSRLLDLAERLRVPVLTLIDTPGAAADARAEAEGVGPAIADVLLRVAGLQVPVTSVLIGEGGSGGALALAAEGRLWAAPDGYFAVTAPELVAEIVVRDSSRAPELARQMRLTPTDLVELGLARGVLTAEKDLCKEGAD